MPLFSIQDFTIDESRLPDIARKLSLISWARFYKVILKQDELSELHEFDNLSKLVAHEQNSGVVYHFVDMKFENTLPLYLFIEVDKSRKRITYFKSYVKLLNGWEMYFNYKNSIIFKNPYFDINHEYTRLADNFPYRGVDFFVGISSLVEVMKETRLNSFLQILPILEVRSSKLKDVRYFNHYERT